MIERKLSCRVTLLNLNVVIPVTMQLTLLTLNEITPTNVIIVMLYSTLGLILDI